MSWLTTIVAASCLLGAPPEDAAQSNRPVSVPPRDIERVDPQVVRAIEDRPEIQDPTQSDVIPASGDRRAISISPSTLRKESFVKRPVDDDGNLPKLPNRSLAWWTTTGVGLAVVLTIIFIGGRVAKRFVPGASVGEGQGPIHLLYRTFLSPKHTVCLVKCGDRLLLIGLSGDRMQNLSEIHDPQEIDYIRGQLMQVQPRSTTQAFKEVFRGKSQLAEASESVAMEEETHSGPTFAEGRTDVETGRQPRRDFIDHLSALRQQITHWKSKAPST